jgi:hypothetical protein
VRAQSRSLRVGKKTSAFLSTLDQRLFKRSRIGSDFRDRTFTLRCSRLRGVIPEPLFDETRRLGRPQNMAGLYWKSDAATTVIHPLLKGTGDPPERHVGRRQYTRGDRFRPPRWLSHSTRLPADADMTRPRAESDINCQDPNGEDHHPRGRTLGHYRKCKG